MDESPTVPKRNILLQVLNCREHSCGPVTDDHPLCSSRFLLLQRALSPWHHFKPRREQIQCSRRFLGSPSENEAGLESPAAPGPFPHVPWGRCGQNKVRPAGLWGLDTYTVRCPFSRTPAPLQAVAFIQLQICLRLSLETDS